MQIKIKGIEITEENINSSINDDGDTPLHHAVKWFWLQQLKGLLEIPNININKHNNEGYTPLHYVIEENDYKNAELLLQNSDIDVNCIGNYKIDTPLIFCCSFNRNTEILKLLLKHPKININVENSIKYTPLHWAIYNRSWDLVKILLKDERIYPSLFKRNIYKQTPIDIMKKKGNKYNFKIFDDVIPFSPIYFEEIEKLWN